MKSFSDSSLSSTAFATFAPGSLNLLHAQSEDSFGLPRTPIQSLFSLGSLNFLHAQQDDSSGLPRTLIQFLSSSTSSSSSSSSRLRLARKQSFRVQSSSTPPSISQYFARRDRGRTPSTAIQKNTSTQSVTCAASEYHRRRSRILNPTATKVVKPGRSRKPSPVSLSIRLQQYNAKIAAKDEVAEKISTWLRNLFGSSPIPVDTSVADPPAGFNLDEFYNSTSIDIDQE